MLCARKGKMYRGHVFRVSGSKNTALRAAVAVTQQLQVLELAQVRLCCLQVLQCQWHDCVACSHVHLSHPATQGVTIKSLFVISLCALGSLISQVWVVTIWP